MVYSAGLTKTHREGGYTSNRIFGVKYHRIHWQEMHALSYNTNEAVILYLLALHSEPMTLSFNTNGKACNFSHLLLAVEGGMALLIDNISLV